MQGSGTKDDPYVVFTYEELALVVGQQGKHAQLGCSIIEPSKVFPHISCPLKELDLNGNKLELLSRPAHGGLCLGMHDCLVINGELELKKHNGNYSGYHCVHRYYGPGRMNLKNIKVRLEISQNLSGRYGVSVSSNHSADNNENVILEVYGQFAKSVRYQARYHYVYIADFIDSRFILNTDIKWSDLPPGFSNEQWEIRSDGIYIKERSDFFISGKTMLLDQPVADRIVDAIPVRNYRFRFSARSDHQGDFYLPVGSYGEPMLLMCYDSAEFNLISRHDYDVGQRALPPTQNSYAYTCTKAGTTDILPDILPTSGTFVSGTAEFSISQLRPPVIYGPVTPAKKV